jgi:cellulose synthase/poly-beta-1,6-N-acetylglucosamine synthase-like glycosyltransferase
MNFWPTFNFDFWSVTLIVFLIVVGYQILHVIFFNFRLLIHKSKTEIKDSELPPLSVIICARNEESNLFKLIPLVAKQDYPKFELIIVNDQSQDDSIHIIKAYKKEFPFIRIIELEKNKHRQFGKKLPLTVGIKGSKYNHIVVTDADCKPVSDQWLKTTAKLFNEKKEIVLGYSPYKKLKGFLNKLIRFDTSIIAITYMSYAKNRLAYMGVGRNMAYSKKLWEEVDGFKNHYHIASGDDDLFIKDVSKKNNTTINMDPKSYIYSDPKTTWTSWINQKARHFTTATEYKLINKLFLGIFPLTLFMMYFIFVILLFNTDWYYFVLAVFGLRLLIYWVINGLLLKKLEAKDLIWLFPFYELLHSIVIPFIYYSNLNKESKKW